MIETSFLYRLNSNTTSIIHKLKLQHISCEKICDFVFVSQHIKIIKWLCMTIIWWTISSRTIFFIYAEMIYCN